MRGMRAFVFTFDVIFAFTLLAMVMLLAFSQTYPADAIKSARQKTLAMDMLSSFEKSGTLARSLTNQSEMRLALNALPPNTCAIVSVTDATNRTIVRFQREGCTGVGDVRAALRTFYIGGRLYMAHAQVWSQ